MTPKTLRVRASGTGCVQNHERLEGGTNSFIGRKFQERKDLPGTYGFVPTNEIEEVPYRAEYIHALKAGDLQPADKATADAAGVEFSTKATLPAPASSNEGADR